MQTWEDRLAFRGEEICLETPNGVALNGKLVGIEADGGLRLRLADGSDCLLYTSDAADDLPRVVLGGLRLIKKKKTNTHTPL